jgi:hypothetical protein
MRNGTSHGRVIFVLPNTMCENGHNIVVNDALVLDAFKFCVEVTSAAMKLFDGHPTNVKKNYGNLLQYRPDGIFPYINGLPVIA